MASALHNFFYCKGTTHPYKHPAEVLRECFTSCHDGGKGQREYENISTTQDHNTYSDQFFFDRTICNVSKTNTTDWLRYTVPID
jgi:hypothetical protein